jgi:hypothetical protein
MSRALQVVRIQLFSAYNGVFWPWAILASAFAVNLAVFASIGDEIPDGPVSGGLASIYVTAIIVGTGLVYQFLPFMIGFGVTRRTFFAATSLSSAAWALLTGIALYLLALIERATGGWGLRLRFFDLPFLARHNPLLHILEYVSTMALMVFLGFLLGAIALRWGSNGVMTLTVATIVVGGVVSVLITWQRGWDEFFGFFADQPVSILLTAWPAVLAALAAAGTYLAVRRTPV